MEQKQRVRHRDEAVELIECCLRTNDIPPHGKLPAEREMCEMWGAEPHNAPRCHPPSDGNGQPVTA